LRNAGFTRQVFDWRVLLPDKSGVPMADPAAPHKQALHF